MKKIQMWMLAAILTCSTTMMTSCSNDETDNPVNPSEETVDQQYAEDLMNRLKGCWTTDMDGIPELDLFAMDFIFDQAHNMDITLHFYDSDLDDYRKETLNLNYKVKPRTTDEYGRVMERIAVYMPQSTADHLVELGILSQSDLEDEDFSEPDILEFAIDGDKFYVAGSLDDVDPDMRDDVEEGSVNLTTTFIKGEPKLDKSTVKSFLEEVMDEVNQSPNSQITRANDTSHERSNWMKDIPDNQLVCKMVIPGAHDTTTGNISDEWMLTFGKTQLKSLGELWDYGCRAFDIRTRYTNGPDHTLPGMYEAGNWTYHGALDCNMTLKESINQIVNKMLEHKTTDGVILMIQNEDKGFDMFEDASFYFKKLAPLNFNFISLDEKKTTKETIRLVKEELYDKNLLARFSEDMTMGDLRGKVLVFLCNEVKGVDYLGMEDHVCLWVGGQLRTPSGRKAELHSQNAYEPEESTDESDSHYASRKELGFYNMCKYCADNPDGCYWVYNAANGYYREWQKLPDYASMAQATYSHFITSLYLFPHQRGIILQDYIGEQEPFKRVPVWGLLPSTWGGLMSKVAFLVPSLIFGTNGVDYATFWALYKAAKLASSYKNTNGQALADAVIERNFNNEKSSVNPADLVPTSGSVWRDEEGYLNLFDGNKDTKWCVQESNILHKLQGWYVEFHSYVPKKAKSYTLTTGNDTDAYPRRNPMKWALYAKYGIDDEWQLIDEVDNSSDTQKQLPPASKADKEFTIKTPGEYMYYRLIVSSSWDSNSAWLPLVFSDAKMQLAEFKFNYE